MYRILIVDDEARIRELIRKYAEFEGHSVSEASDGLTAVHMCRQHEFDIVIMDIMMPELDGFSACREIRKTSNVPILMLSARGEEYDRINGFQLGIDDYRSGCLPETKVEYVENVKRTSRVAVVGDGVNDAPALAAGDLGIAMGAIGSDIAVNSASVALMTNDLRRIAVLLFLAKKSQVIINQNLLFGMLFVFGGMILSIVGVMTPIWAAVLHAGSTVVIVFNSARLVRTGEELTLEENDGERR